MAKNKKENFLNSVQVTAPGRNIFDLSHDVKLSMNMGELIPVMCTPTIPGDRFSIGCESMVRLAPMVAPMMHRCDITVHYFFVPNRLVWPNWEKFITNTKDSVTNLVPAHPFIPIGEGGDWTRLCDYFGVPNPTDFATAPGTEQISALPFAAYQLIFHEYYRDQNLMQTDNNIYPITCLDGNNVTQTAALTALQRRCWEHDYLTSCLPFAQKGDAVNIPLNLEGEKARILHNDPTAVGNEAQWNQVSGGGSGEVRALKENAADPLIDQDHLYADLSDASAQSTITDLRRAFKLQEWFEKLARGGSRYIEQIKAFFGVKSSDARLQRPEYITGIKAPIMISEVLNTTGTENAAQGDMAGHGIGVTEGAYGSYFCEEHGYIIGVMSVMPKPAYMQGIARHFKKSNPFDYFWPQFEHIGEQEVLGSEVYAYQDAEYASGTFGYIPRYAEYKFENNRVAGDFRTTLDFWHMARDFDAPPSLNAQFVTCDPTHRIFAVEDPDVQKLWCHVYNKVKASRLMSKYGSPSF